MNEAQPSEIYLEADEYDAVTEDEATANQLAEWFANNPPLF
jgi:hypothetical protein